MFVQIVAQRPATYREYHVVYRRFIHLESHFLQFVEVKGDRIEHFMRRYRAVKPGFGNPAFRLFASACQVLLRRRKKCRREFQHCLGQFYR